MLIQLPAPTRGEAFKKLHEAVVTPADYVQNIFEEKGFLTYAGTYVGKACSDKALGRSPLPSQEP